MALYLFARYLFNRSRLQKIQAALVYEVFASVKGDLRQI